MPLIDLPETLDGKTAVYDSDLPNSEQSEEVVKWVLSMIKHHTDESLSDRREWFKHVRYPLQVCVLDGFKLTIERDFREDIQHEAYEELKTERIINLEIL